MLKERNCFIDTLKGVLIILVLVGHFGGDNDGTSSILNAIEFFIYTFHMPVFVFISGYLSKNLEKNRQKGFEYLIDFVLLNIVWAIFSAIVLRDKSYLLLIWQPGYALWYIPALGIWKFFLKEILKIKHVVIFSFILAIFSICTIQFQPIFGLPRVIAFLPFFLIGYYSKENVFEMIRKIPTIICVLIMIGVYIVSFYVIKETNINLGLLYHNYTYRQIVEGSENIINAVLLNGLSYVFALTAGICFINICKFFEKNKFLMKLGKRTLPIYVISIYIQRVLFVVLHYVIGEKFYLNDYENYFIALFFVMVTLIVCSSSFVVNIFNLILEKWKRLVLRTNVNT